jgi:hypothetical protein
VLSTPRPFGHHAADLEADFGAPRPHLVTALLSACALPAASPAACWALPAGERTAGLLRIVAAGGTAVLEAVSPCGGCGARLELPLPVDDLLALHASAPREERVTVAAGDERVTLRRATGADQAAWWEAAPADPASAFGQVLRTLRVDGGGGLPRGVELARVDQALAEADPLVAFTVDTACPACGRAHAVPVDLQGLALAVLRRAQGGLIADVHRIARAYHWAEERIAALPAWRRARYLALIEREEGA